MSNLNNNKKQQSATTQSAAEQSASTQSVPTQSAAAQPAATQAAATQSAPQNEVQNAANTVQAPIQYQPGNPTSLFPRQGTVNNPIPVENQEEDDATEIGEDNVPMSLNEKISSHQNHYNTLKEQYRNSKRLLLQYIDDHKDRIPANTLTKSTMKNLFYSNSRESELARRETTMNSSLTEDKKIYIKRKVQIKNFEKQ